MTQISKRIYQLKALAYMKLNLELQQLKAITAQNAAPTRVLEMISHEKCSIQADTGKFTQATLTSMDENWERWAFFKQKTALAEMAVIAQKRERQLKVAQQAFGRADALKTLAKKI